MDRVKIGYAVCPKLPLSHPAYRRRFGGYLAARGLSWEIADVSKRYDIVVVHHSADLPAWIGYDGGKLILDYNDDYLGFGSTGGRDVIRGVGRYATGAWSRPYLDYKAPYREVAKRADAVVCAAESGAMSMAPYCANIRKILDMQPDFGWAPKRSHVSGATAHLVWEGFPSFAGLISVREGLLDFKRRRLCHLHLVTNLVHARFSNAVFPMETRRTVQKRVRIPDTYLYDWHPATFPSLVTAADMAMIPIDMTDPVWVGKPANKLLSFWRLGMPTLVSDTPAYRAMMDEAGVDMVCTDPASWSSKLDSFMGDDRRRAEVGTHVAAHAAKFYNNDALCARWDEAIASVL